MTNRLSLHAGKFDFEIEGSEELVRDGLEFVRTTISAGEIKELSLAVETPDTDIRSSQEPSEGDRKTLIDLRAFYEARNPKNDMQKVVVLAQYAKEHMDLAEVTESDVLPLFQESGDKKLPNDIGNTLRNGTRKQYGWLEAVPGKRGTFRVTNAGYRLVHVDILKES